MSKSTWSIRVSNDLLYQKYEVLKINDLYELELGTFMYFYHAKAQPEIFQTYFLPIDLAHGHNTRNNSNKNYFLNTVKTNDGKSSIQFHGVQLWNPLPSSVKSCSFYRFKKEYTTIL